MTLFGRRKTVCVTSNKGGVGKTVIAIGIAEALALKSRVVLLDLDVHGPDVLIRLGLDPSLADFTRPLIQPIPYKPNIWAFSADCIGDSPAHGYLAKDEDKRAFVRSSMKSLDYQGAKYVVCDMPAGTDEILYTLIHEVKPEAIVLVTNPEQASLLDTEKLVNILKHYNMLDRVLGVVENMAYVEGPDGIIGHRFNNGSAKELICQPYSIAYLGGIPEYVDWGGCGGSSSRLYSSPVFKTIAESL